MADTHRKLMKITDNVASGVKAFHCCLLVRVHGYIASFCTIGIQGDSEFRTDLASKRRI
jgi:hypothetical protein